mmetsp:Transcript_35717/g.46992  ORF Transcript_35717/g.46992 Transcript_35717/m.46992 type:complete len:109 (-) Transcript_35717:1522-1848(-)
MSFKSTALSARNRRVLDPTIIDNDYETPQYVEPRARPAPDFLPRAQMKPKLLRAAESKKQLMLAKRRGSVQPMSTRGKDLDRALNIDIVVDQDVTPTAKVAASSKEDG